jgi:hypothetical protein
MFLCCLIGVVANATRSHDVILRANDGFVAQPVGQLTVSGDYWFHTLVVKIPNKPRAHDYEKVSVGGPLPQSRFAPLAFFTNKQEIITMNIDLQCSANISSTAHLATVTDCYPFGYLTRFQYLLKAKNLRYLDQIYDTLETFVANNLENEATRRFRRKSGWATFLSWFRIGSTDDIEILNENIKQLQAATQIGFEQFAVTADKFHSFAHLTNQHLQELNSAVASQATFSYRNQRHTNAALTYLLHLIMQLTQYVDGSQNLLYLESQLSKLIEGQLPRSLISPETVAAILTNITEHLEKYNVPLYLSDSSPLDVYKRQSFLLSRQVSTLTITLQFPLTITRSKLTVYRVFSLLMKVDDNNQHASYIQNLPKFIAYHSDEPWFLEFDDLPHLPQNIYDIATNPTALHHRAEPTCALALIESNRELIHKLCQFVIKPFAARPNVLALGRGKILLQFIDEYSLECQNDTFFYTGCSLCVLDIKCRCKFKAGIFQFYAKIANCGDDSEKDASVQYAINLPYIEQFFNGSELLRESNELLDSLPTILLPNLTFQQYSTDKSAGLLRESLFNMQELAQSALNDSQIFLSIGDQIADQLAQNQLDIDHQTFSIKSIETILIFLNPVLVIGLVVGFARIYWKFRTITAALLLIRPPSAHAATIPRKIFVPHRWRTPLPVVGSANLPAFTLPPLKQIELPSDATWQEITTALLALILLLLLIRYVGPLFLSCCRKLKKAVKTVTPNVEFTITLSVGNTDQYVSLPMISLPFAYEEYDFKAEKFLTGLSVENYLCPHLTVKWPELKINHRFAPLTYKLPKSVNLTYLQAYRIRQILKHPHFVLMHVRFGTKSRILPLMESDWFSHSARADVRLHSASLITLPRDNPPLYPQLEEATFV